MSTHFTCAEAEADADVAAVGDAFDDDDAPHRSHDLAHITLAEAWVQLITSQKPPLSRHVISLILLHKSQVSGHNARLIV